MDDNLSNTTSEETVDSSCPNCGSKLKFLPGTNKLQCESCGSVFDIVSLGQGRLQDEEVDYVSTINKLSEETSINYLQRSIHCESCGAMFLINSKCISTACPFCGSNKVIEENKEEQIIKINGVIPFILNEKDVMQCFKKWIKSKFLAPGKFKSGLAKPSFSGFYIPFYTFDSNSSTHYTAMRGNYYYVTRTIHSKNGTRFVQERHINWTPVSGNFNLNFDDVLVNGTNNSYKNMIDNIMYYDFNKMEKYQEEYLMGYYTEKASMPLNVGFEEAKKVMISKIKLQCIKNIKGDTYSNLKFQSNFNNITFKQIVVPIYNGHYMFRNKTYNFICNGQNGKFVGNYPISKLKVFLIVFGIIAIIITIFVILYFYLNGWRI